MLFMPPRIKMIVKIKRTLEQHFEMNAKFLAISAGLDHALVVCDLTQIPPPVSGLSHR